jgi:dTDP-4-amino-4,6-dideoxygalactose transaminase
MTTAPVLLGGKAIRTKSYQQYPRIMGNELQEVGKVLSGDNWLNANVTKRFEEALAEYVGSRFAVAVNTGGIALMTALRAMGIEPGDEVLMKMDTCVADAFAVFNVGGVPVFADSNPLDFSLDWDSVEKAIGP